MTKCKRMLVAILILSMLSGNVAYASGGNMGVVVTAEEAVTANVEGALEEPTQEMDTSDMLSDITVSENGTDDDVACKDWQIRCKDYLL